MYKVSRIIDPVTDSHVLTSCKCNAVDRYLRWSVAKGDAAPTDPTIVEDRIVMSFRDQICTPVELRREETTRVNSTRGDTKSTFWKESNDARLIDWHL